jgi:hypothetical protein
VLFSIFLSLSLSFWRSKYESKSEIERKCAKERASNSREGERKKETYMISRSGVKHDLINNGAFLIRENRKIKAEYSRRGSQSANERQSDYESKRETERERAKERASNSRE